MHALRRAVAADPESPEWPPDLAYALALAGERDEARAILREAERRESRLAGAAAFNIGRAWMALGDTGRAFAWLERSDWRWAHRANLHNPTLDPLRADPRFARLSARVAREVGMR